MSRPSMLPSSKHTPWAKSDRYKDFGAQYHSQPDGHARSVHPHVPLVGPRAPDRTRTQPLAAVLVLVLEPAVSLKRFHDAHDSTVASAASRVSSPPPASTITSTASLSTSTILRGRSMRGRALAWQLVRARRLASVTASGRRSDRDLPARDYS